MSYGLCFQPRQTLAHVSHFATQLPRIAAVQDNAHQCGNGGKDGCEKDRDNHLHIGHCILLFVWPGASGFLSISAFPLMYLSSQTYYFVSRGKCEIFNFFYSVFGCCCLMILCVQAPPTRYSCDGPESSMCSTSTRSLICRRSIVRQPFSVSISVPFSMSEHQRCSPVLRARSVSESEPPKPSCSSTSIH